MSDTTEQAATASTVLADAEPTPPALDTTRFRRVDFDKPLQRGALTITGVTIRKPDPGALRGLQIMQLIQMDATQVQTLLPRITDPPLTPGDFGPGGVDVVDLVEMAAEVSDFLLARKKSNVFPTA